MFVYKDDQNEKNILAYLDSEGVVPIVVPMRQNRVVMFNSNLFHKSDTYTFSDKKYEHRRINVTFLFGKRQPSRHVASRPRGMLAT